jgi:RimJ/RimL family protein N-acetyltransferase
MLNGTLLTSGGRYMATMRCGVGWQDGPYAEEAALRRAVKEKQTGTGAIFLALAPAGGQPGSPRTGPGPWGGRAEGYASYMRIDPAHGVIEVGNIMLSPSLQRTTAATEAMYLMARHVFEDLGYRRYEWKCNAKNEPSRRAALRLGFTYEGIFRQHMVIKDENRDTAWFSMLDSEWPARKMAFEAWLEPANFDASGRQKQGLAEFLSSRL